MHIFIIFAKSCKIDYEKTGATDADDGAKNMAIIRTFGLGKYPAFEWCANLGVGWYLPAENELQAIYDQKAFLKRLY